LFVLSLLASGQPSASAKLVAGLRTEVPARNHPAGISDTKRAVQARRCLRLLSPPRNRGFRGGYRPV